MENFEPRDEGMTDEQVREHFRAETYRIWPTEEAFWDFIHQDSARIRGMVDQMHQQETLLTPEDLADLRSVNERAKELKERLNRRGTDEYNSQA